MPSDPPAGGGRLWPVVFFGGLLLLGLRIAGDYGLSIDEFTNHYFGVAWYRYAYDIAVNHAPLVPLANTTEHDVVHGPAVEMALAFVEHSILHLTELRPIVLFRHAATWVIFWLGAVAFYFLARRLFASGRLALLACVFLVVHPRIFAHAFYDSVDIPFLAFYIFSLWTLVRYLDRRTLGALGLHAAVCAVTIDIRSLGALIPAMTLGLLAIEALTRGEPARSVPRRLGRIGLFLAVLTLTTILFWPYLWTDPLARAREVIRLMPKVDWAGLVLYAGHEINATKLPWHYLPVWIAITTPLIYSVFFVIGLGESLVALGRNPAAFWRERLAELVVGAALFGPLLAVIVLHAIVYDTWRHLFFVYPAFVLVAIGGVKRTLAAIEAIGSVRARRLAQGVVAAAIALNLATVGGFMVRNHPQEHVYFNRLAGKDMTEIKRRFEMDYWGLAYRQALEYVMAHDRSDPVKIFHGNNAMFLINRSILPPAERDRTKSVEFDEATYVFTNFRQVRGGYPDLAEYYTIKVGGETIFCVYRKVPQGK